MIAQDVHKKFQLLGKQLPECLQSRFFEGRVSFSLAVIKTSHRPKVRRNNEEKGTICVRKAKNKREMWVKKKQEVLRKGQRKQEIEASRDQAGVDHPSQCGGDG